MFFLILLLAPLAQADPLLVRPRSDACPIFCRCYSAIDGYHVGCRSAALTEIPSTLTRFLQTTSHQNLRVDLSCNSLLIIPCLFFQISGIIALNLTANHLQSLPACLSQSSIEILHLKKNNLHFNDTTLPASLRLLYLDISDNRLGHLPRAFFARLRRLRTLVVDGHGELFHPHHDQWLRSLTTRNQLTLIICDAQFHLPPCLFDNLFQSRKLQAIELNRKLHCDCPLVSLPVDRVRFQSCQSHLPPVEQLAHCDVHSSRFAPGRSWIELHSESNRQRCATEHQACRTRPAADKSLLLASDIEPAAEFLAPIKTTSPVNESITSTLTTETSSKRDHISAGAIIPFVLVLLIVTVVCLYVLLSGRLLKAKAHGNATELIGDGKRQHVTSSANTNKASSPFDECLSVENINMNSNPRQRAHSDAQSELTFYSVPNQHASSTSFVQSSMSDAETSSTTSTMDSSLDNATVIVSSRSQQRRY